MAVARPRAIPEPRGGTATEPEAAVDDARFMVGHLASLTTNADTKAGLVATATTVLIGVALAQRQGLVQQFTGSSTLAWAALVVFGAAVLSGLVAVGAVARALWPRLVASRFSRYSWPAVTGVAPVVLTRSGPGSEREEAWTTVQDMSRILQVKYRSLRIAISAWLVAAAFLALWFLLAG